MPCYHDNITENAWRYRNNLLKNGSNENKELKNISTAAISNKFNNEFFEFFSEMFKDFDSLKFIDDLIIGIVGSEIASIGVIIIAAASITNPEILLAGISIFLIGETIMAYSDGLFDKPNLIDGGFFLLDSALAVTTPFADGGLKVGAYSMKIFIEKNLNKFKDIMLKTTSVKINIEYIRWGLDEIIYKNLDDKTFKEHGKDFLNNWIIIIAISIFFFI